MGLLHRINDRALLAVTEVMNQEFVWLSSTGQRIMHGDRYETFLVHWLLQ